MTKDKHSLTFSAVVISLSVFFFAVCAMDQNYWSTTKESNWAIMLFSIPLLVQGTGWLALYFADRDNSTVATFCNFYVGTMLISSVSYCSLWIAYLSGKRGNLYSYLALGLVALLVSLVLTVTFAIMKPPLTGRRGQKNGSTSSVFEWMERLRTGLVLMPFWALLHFFAIFLSVAFAFGFALAFHDLSIDDKVKKPPLYKATLPFHDQKPAEDSDLRTALCFHFAEGKAQLEMLPATANQVVVATDVQKREMDRKHNNNNFLNDLVGRVKASPASKLARITLIGHANETRIKDNAASYLSNYELSQARTQVVRYEISRALIQNNYGNWRNVEWIMLPLSNEQSANMSGPGPPACKEGLQDNKVVEASVEYVANDPASVRLEKDNGPEFERLDLMGYMYFSIYTITTTGYGDVIPTTPYAKFVTSLANVFAIFFLVGFINALISLKTQRKDA